jgi:threonine/homoserine/homoserine lactone efflux protein
MLAAFLALSVVVIVTPGPDTALTIRNTLLGGRRAGLATAVGVCSGQAVWTAATSAGVAALIVASDPAFTAVKLLGAAYLVFLGVQALWHAARGSAPARPEAAGERLPGRAAVRQGLLSDLGNPKMAVFFTSLLPQFAPRGGGAFAVMLALGLLFCLLTFAWLALYAAVVARAGDVLRRPRVRRALDAALGTVLVALGVRLAQSSRS